MARLVAVDPIQHDGKLIAPGESFDVPDEAAPALLACGAAVAATAHGSGAAEAPAPQAAPEPARRRSRSSEG